jgi:hypothetical protein
MKHSLKSLNSSWLRSFSVGAFVILLAGLLLGPKSLIAEGLPCSSEQNLQFYFVDGRVIAASIRETHLNWTNVADDGRAEIQKIEIADIRKIVLTESPAAKQIAEIRQLIEQLNSNSYSTREAAEKKLSDPSFAAAFYDLIDRRANDRRLEVRYRLRRILARLDEDRVQAPLRFDTLVLKNGDTMMGDAGVFEWEADCLGRSIKIRRNELTMVDASRGGATVRQEIRSMPVEVKLFYDHKKFVDENVRQVDFSVDPNGNRLGRRDNVNETFVPWGLRFTPRGKGYVGIPGFSFSHDSFPVGEQSIARFNDNGRSGIPYKGVIAFEFCVPNQINIPAGVKKFGTFIATVDSPRSFVVEAFNVHGELVGLVESPATKCGFLGIETSVPFHRIQIRSNPYLYRVDGNVDDDFALDTFYFSKPEPVAMPSGGDYQLIVLKDGTRLTGQFKFRPSNRIQLKAVGLGDLEFPMVDVAEISFGRESEKLPKQWYATIDDGSTVIVNPRNGFESEWLDKISKSRIVALYNSSNPKRYPLSGDFEKSDAVLVYPTCRIPLAKLNLTQDGFSWPENSEKILQPVDESSPLGVPGKDPTPQVNEVDFAKSTADQIPTVWLEKPRSLATGYVRLVDDQVLSLNTNRILKAIEQDAILIVEGRRVIEIPLEQVAAIFLADN